MRLIMYVEVKAPLGAYCSGRPLDYFRQEVFMFDLFGKFFLWLKDCARWWYRLFGGSNGPLQ